MNFIKQKIAKATLRKYLHQQLAGEEPGRPLTKVHASDVTGSTQFCPRERAYQVLLKKKPPPQRLSTSEQITYGIGRWLEEKIVETFVAAGMVVGTWKCLHCSSKYTFCKRPPKCVECGHRFFEHIEQRALSDLTGISCGIDLLLDMPGEAKHKVVEIKSMDKDVFKALVAPLAEHRTRTRLYLRSIAESSQPWTELVDTQSALILYTTKGGYGTACDEVPLWNFWDSPFSPFKDYVIERDDNSIEHAVLPALQYKVWKDQVDAAVGDKAFAEIPLPDRICASSLDKRAKYCSCLNPCFIKSK